MQFDRNDPLPGKYDIPRYVRLTLLVVMHTIDSRTLAARIGLAENSLGGSLSTDIGNLSTLSTIVYVIVAIPRYGLVLIPLCDCSRIECALQSVDRIDTDRTWETV
jgi:hypothetical protein